MTDADSRPESVTKLDAPGDLRRAVEVDDADLQDSLRALAGLIMGARGLEELLAQVATFAVRAIPGADGAGVTLLRIDRPGNRVQALAASHQFVSEIDEIQYGALEEGPCITAARERRTVRTGSLGAEPMWPRFGPAVSRLGVHSALSLPLVLRSDANGKTGTATENGKSNTDGESGEYVIGAINVYGRGRDVFDERAERLGELFAAPAAVAVHNAQMLGRARELTAQLEHAMSTRPVIDQAIGLIRGRTGATEDEAMERLRAISQQENVKLSVIATRIMNQAVRRAHARGSST